MKAKQETQKMIVSAMLWPLIKKGVIAHTLLSHKEYDEGLLRVYAPGHESEAITFEVTFRFRAGNGYLPEGYPEQWRVRGSNTGALALRVKRVEDKKTARAPGIDEGEE